ncbi:MAG: succinate dehydrogenase [Candidatus Omnitrophica bacterium]|nr:succinate dehydrogenase [Candidatus Omnitrophota bacterium]
MKVSVLKQYFTNMFYLRRIHSALGAIPVGLFVVEHMLSNFLAVFGPERYDEHVRFLTSVPFLPVIEIGFIGLPIFLHLVLGVYIVYTAKQNAGQYVYPRNWMYTLQRVSGVILVFYIGFHVWNTRIQGVIQDKFVGFEHMREHLSHPAILVFYVLGAASALFHFANGLWGFCISWGITVTPRAQFKAGIIFYVIGFILCAAGLLGLFSFNRAL